MTLYNRRKFNPARGGHAPGHLRDAFLQAIEADNTSRDAIVVVGDSEAEIPFSRLCGLLWNCTDFLPGDAADELECGTYAQAARKLSGRLTRLQNFRAMMNNEDLEESPEEQAFQDEIDMAWDEIAEKHGCSVGDAMLLGLDKNRIRTICEKHGVAYEDDASR